MVIAAHISADSADSPLLASLLILAEKNNANRFIILSEKELSLPENMLWVKAAPRGNNFLFQQYWYSYTLPGLLQKYQAEIFISDTGISSRKVLLPQFLFFSDHSFEYKTGLFFRRNFPGSLQQSKCIFVTEDFIAEILKGKYNLPAEKIQTVYHGLTGRVAEHTGTEEMIKKKFTNGYDYFLFPADTSSSPHAVLLLKAFSQLKKRQKSSMKLVMLLNNISAEELVPDLKNYKYRDDVLMISVAEKNAGMLIPHAYAMIWLGIYTPGTELFSAMQNNVAVIAEENDTNTSLLGGAAVFAKLSAEDLSEKMQLLYKDEAFKNGVGSNAADTLQKYDAWKAAESLYRGITG